LDLAGGEMTHPGHSKAVPTLKLKDRAPLYLIETANPVLESLIGSYEITSLPEAPYGNRNWLGNFNIGSDLSYSYKDNGQFHKPGDDNFLMHHLSGKVSIRYADKVSAETLLESLPEGSTVVELTFTAENTNDRLVLKIGTYARMFFIFNADPRLNFSGYGNWKKN
jgi:hypothetical protein